MSEVFFISDTHFGHRGILTFSGTKALRPFATIEEHDAELVRRWNATVGKNDTVWHLGDFCFGKRNLQIAAELNGNKKLVMGNHDMYAAHDYLQFFTRIFGAVEYKGLLLTHIPVHEEQFHRYYLNVHGHLHHRRVMKVLERGRPDAGIDAVEEEDHRYINVSCEQQNLTPVPYDEILNRWAEHN